MKHTDVKKIWLVIAEKGQMLIPVVAVILSITTFIYKLNTKEEANLPMRIGEVENAIESLRNLEGYLEKTKSEMISTEQAKEKIEKEYSKAKELAKLTEQQVEAISLAVNKRTKTDVIVDYLWGFILGVGSSLGASYLYGLLKRK